jgi:uncharacterized protein YjdB
MNKIKKIALTMVFGLLLTSALLNLTGTRVKAASTTLPDYHFVFDSTTKNNGSEYELKRDNVSLSVVATGWASPSTVVWSSSEEGVVALEASSTNPLDTSRRLKRVGPGFSTIKAVVTQGGLNYTIRCTVKVDLEFDYQKTGMTTATTNSARILVINEIDNVEKPIYLKYMDYDADGTAVPVSGGAISATAVIWESDNEEVAKVSVNGKVKAVGSGSATITATSNTMSSQDKPMKISMKVVVKPTFSLDFSTPSNPKDSSDNVNAPSIVTGVPSTFVIKSNAKRAVHLKWEIYDSSTKAKLPAGTSSKMTYLVSEISGAVEFTKVKAGTYEIYAFADESYNSSTNAPYAYMKIIVPIDVGPKSIVMTVGDTYSILENSNIPVAGVFTYVSANNNIVLPNQNTSIITAMGKGTAKVTLTYVPSYKLFDSTNAIVIELNVTVIDGISLSTSNATLFTKSTLLLNAIVTDPTEPIIWSTSDSKIASVEGGLVTGLTPGIATITAKQTINGVVKKATCLITVQQSVATIVVDPEEFTLPIGGYTTLHATITPKNLNNVVLKWKSSDESIVKVVEASALTATIQGVAGGHAVISAINQDNVVVGYCHVSVQQSATSVVLSETDVTVDLTAKRLQIRATVYPVNALNKAVVWSSTDETKAKVDQNGLVTLLKPGTVSIIATSDDNAKAKAICNINIQIPVVSIALDETTKTMYVGQAARLSYVLLPNNASKNTVTWTSTNPSVASVDATGKVSAKSVGTTVIILKTLDGGYSIYCTITVKSVATGIKFDVSELNLKTGEAYYLKPTLTPKDSTDNDLVWESSDTKIAIVDDNGKVIAKDAGTAIIMARTEVGGVAYCKVTVTEPVKGLILNFSEKTIFIGDEFKLKVSVSPSEASELGVTWKSSNPKVATISKTGEVTGLVGGVTVITCTTLDGGYSATCVLTVRESVTTIKLDYETYRLGVKKTATLNATVTTETATNLKVFWSTSNDRVATVNQKGKVTGIALGYATITATAMDGSEVEASCEVRVVTPVDSITMDKAYMAMLVGDSKDLDATIRPSNSTYRTAKWTSTDDSVAIVDDNGVVTALKAGSATIKAEAKDNTGKTAICYVAVRDRLPSTGITLIDKKLVMVPGEEKKVEVRLNPAESTDSTTWSTDNAAIARVDKKTGKISARSTGTANITVMTDSGKTANIEVIVIGLNMTELVLEQYTTYPYPLQVEGATTAVSWSIDNPQVAVVTNGNVSTRAVGTATITATVNGRKLKCRLKVIKID